VPPSRPCSVHMVSHHLDGFLLLAAACSPLGPHILRADGARIFQRASDPGVHDVSAYPIAFLPFRADTLPIQPPRRAFLPFEATSPNTAAAASQTGEASPPLRRGKLSPPPPVARLKSSPTSLPSRRLPPRSRWEVAFPCPAPRSGLKALLHVRVRCHASGCPPASPDAPMGLNDALLHDANSSCPGSTRAERFRQYVKDRSR